MRACESSGSKEELPQLISGVLNMQLALSPTLHLVRASLMSIKASAVRTSSFFSFSSTILHFFLSLPFSHLYSTRSNEKYRSASSHSLFSGAFSLLFALILPGLRFAVATNCMHVSNWTASCTCKQRVKSDGIKRSERRSSQLLRGEERRERQEEEEQEQEEEEVARKSH